MLMTDAFGVLIRAAFVAAALCLPAIAQAQAPSHLIVFGDSLSDTGNDLLATSATPLVLPPPQMYAAGRFSNGPVAFEYLWSLLNGGAPVIPPSLAVPALPPQGAVSFAFGGSGSGDFSVSSGFQVPGLLTQIAMFGALLQGTPAPETALYAIWTGSNDYLTSPGQPRLSPPAVVANIAVGIRTLYGLGARDILVLNVPDFGRGPLVPADQRDLLTGLSVEHNKLLARTLKTLEKDLPGLTIIEVDVTKVQAAVRRTFDSTVPLVDVLIPVPPGAVPASLCLSISPETCPAVPTFAPDAEFAFWDSEHPTTAAHQRLAEAVLKAVLKGLRRPAARE
jgi:phospholipase/lecithinase/hemolysin